MILSFITSLLALSLLSQVTSDPCFPVPSNLPSELPCERDDTCSVFPRPPPISVCSAETKTPSSETTVSYSTVSALRPTVHASTTTVSSLKPGTLAFETTVPPETAISSPDSAEYSSEERQVSRNRIFKRQAQAVGRANLGGCENYMLRRVSKLFRHVEKKIIE